MTLGVRPATQQDIPALIAIAQDAVVASLWSDTKYQDIFTGGSVRRLALVAEEGGTLQGFVVANAVGSEWEVENLAVARQAQRHGYGSQLMNALLDIAKQEGAETMFLEVRRSNAAARSFYEKWSFVENGVRRGYYSGPEDALVYRLTL